MAKRSIHFGGRYKLFFGRNIKKKLKFLFVSQPTRYFEFFNLKSNAMYFVQLQALSTFGKTKLKSTKVSLMLNTSGDGAQDTI